MKIKTITSEYGNDFYFTAECEHCGHVSGKLAGYHDNHYHARVIPAMHCLQCGLNRAGAAEHTDAGVSPVTV